MRKQVRPTVAFLASVSCFALSAASAQAAVPAPKSDIAALDEVVITAERRETSLQTTPAAVSSFDEKAIARFGTLDTRSLMGLVPNLYVGTRHDRAIDPDLRHAGALAERHDRGPHGRGLCGRCLSPAQHRRDDEACLTSSASKCCAVPGNTLRPQRFGRRDQVHHGRPKARIRGPPRGGSRQHRDFERLRVRLRPLVGSTVLGSLAVYHTETSGYTDAPNIAARSIASTRIWCEPSSCTDRPTRLP